VKTLQVVSYPRQKRAEAAYRKGARKAYRRAWAVLQQHIPELRTVQKKDGPNVTQEMLDAAAAELVSGMTEAGLAAAGILTPEDGPATFARYQQMFGRDVPRGGFKGIADTMTGGIQSSIEEWFRDPEQDAGDLSASLEQWFAPWRAWMVSRTETTRMAAAATQSQADKLGATQFVFVATGDEFECEVCGSYDGETYDMDDDEHTPPIHVNCVCGQQLILPGDEEMDVEQMDAEE
jgi:SPP1 gp7 family putative phage head morphogenesis protein